MAVNGLISAGLSETMGMDVIVGNSTSTYSACVSNSPVSPNLSLSAIHGFSLNYIAQPSSGQPTQIYNSRNLPIGTTSKTVFVKPLIGGTLLFQIGPFETVEMLKWKISGATGIPIHEQRLFLSGTLLQDGNLQVWHCIQHQSILNLTRTIPGGRMLHVKNLMIDKYISLEVGNYETIGNVKAKIQNFTGYNTFDQRIAFSGKALDDNDTLQQCGILNENQPLFLVLKNNIMKVADEDLDPQYNFCYPEKDYVLFSRGGKPFKRPVSWKKFAIKVKGKYENDIWLGTMASTNRTYSVYGEWPVSYHGTSLEAADHIASRGFELRKSRREAYGKGIYSSPDPEVAEGYAKKFMHEGKEYKLMFMNRVNMNNTNEVLTEFGMYYITSNENSIRPYAILIKQVNTNQ